MKTRFVQKHSPRTPARSVKPSLKSGEGVKIEQTITINRPVHEIYAFWRRLENLSRFMRHIESVTQEDDLTSRWVVRAAAGKRLSWRARIIEEKPDCMISWQSLPDADVDHAGSVWFSPVDGGRGTLLKVAMKYAPPGGKIGAALAKLFGGSADQEINEDLQRLKTLLEAGTPPPT